MNFLKNITLIAFLGVFIVSCNKGNKIEETDLRIVSLNGAITETLSAFGYQDNIVGVDVTSTFPEDIKENAQDLGHVSKISFESLVELQPTLILASSKDINEELTEKIRQAKIKLETIEHEQSIGGVKRFIKNIAETLGDNQVDCTSIIEKIDNDFAKRLDLEIAPKVLFVYARGTGTMMVAGKNTPMAKMIELSGGENATNDFENFKPFTPEALVEANPDCILFFTSGLQSLGGIDGLLQIPGVNETNAGRNRRIIDMDGALLSSFGPRTGEAAYKLNWLLSEMRNTLNEQESENR